MAKLGPDDRPGYKNVEVIEGYDRWAATYEHDTNPLIRLEESITLELIGPVPDQRVLDVGCGTGRYCVLLAERGASVVGLDPSAKMLEQARQKTSSYPQLELWRGTIEQMDLPDGSFDLVLSALALSHLPELEPTVSEMVRVLKGGGRLIISDIHPYWPVSGHNYVEFFGDSGQEFRIPEYPHLIEEYWQLLNKLGMQLEEIREPRIESWLIEEMPALAGYLGIPLALIIRARKGALGAVSRWPLT
jgi:ubiquinone/menaquinone biosynthesis C-methylase UbiE